MCEFCGRLAIPARVTLDSLTENTVTRGLSFGTIVYRTQLVECVLTLSPPTKEAAHCDLGHLMLPSDRVAKRDSDGEDQWWLVLIILDSVLDHELTDHVILIQFALTVGTPHPHEVEISLKTRAANLLTTDVPFVAQDVPIVAQMGEAIIG